VGCFLLLGLAALYSGSKTQAVAGGPVVIRSSFWGMAQDARVWQELARRFNARQHRIRVQLEHITGQDYHAKLLAMTVGRCAPDVMASDDEPFRNLAINGVFEDLNPYLAQDKDCALKNFYPAFSATFLVAAHHSALPSTR